MKVQSNTIKLEFKLMKLKCKYVSGGDWINGINCLNWILKLVVYE